MRLEILVFLVLNGISISYGVKFFFNETSSIQVTSAVIPLKSGFTFYFRTCEGGVLLYQVGTGDDYILMHVSPGAVNYNISTNPPHFTPSHLTLSWRVNGQEGSVRAGNELDKSVYYTVTFSPGSGSINATLKLNGPNDYEVNVDKSILDFKHSGPLYAGGGFGGNSSAVKVKWFVGCIESGSNIPLPSSSQGAVNVISGCVLDSQPTCPKKVCQAGFTGYYCETNINDCKAKQCHSYSTCIDGVDSFICKCGPQWNGTLCDNFLGSLCNVNPCQHSGVCKETNDRNNYTCICHSPYAGRNCESILDPCQSTPCKNNATCYRMGQNSTEYNCTCLAGFTGVKCENNIDDCRTSPCDNGRCIDGINSYSCDCSGSGFKGPACSQDIDECNSTSPCLNGATCFNTPGKYSCRCAAGYDGKHCSNNINDCLSKPCENGGTCQDKVNDYNCTCLVGFNGKRCQNDIDDCLKHNCTKNQDCMDRVNGFVCQCKPGYTGSDCMVDIKECLSNPCQNNGTCYEGVNAYNCSCLPRFNGSHCEIDTVNDCVSQPCLNNGTCSDGVADFNCSCPQGFSGKRCELDICDPSPCDNGGNCTKINQFDYNCTCVSGFDGHNCSHNINDCVNNTCVKNATCVDGVNNYTCRCPNGYSGEFCHIDINECASNPCKNNGTCSNEVGQYKCSCLSGFNGTQCENNIDDCPSHGCNNGTCIDGVNGYTCQCDSGFNGTQCEHEINECLNSSSCLNGATCINTVGSYKCLCNQFTNGSRCELDINECSINSSLCQNNGVCDNKEFDGFECLCRKGFFGEYCETNADDCALNFQPCKNGATCVDLVFGYSCKCTSGWKDKHCDQDINECLLGYCKNGATCNNTQGSYNCDCVPGYNDFNCSTDIDECADQPCKNGACHDHVNFYNCTCIPGYEGTNCTHDIDECLSSPCQNNGTCQDGINDFNCTCNSNFTGDFCQYPISRCRPDNPCLNNGTCNTLGVHNYTCNCVPGYGGENCQNTTTVSLNGSSSMAFDVGRSVFNLSLQFRTTLKYGVLADDGGGKILLQLKGDELQLTYNGINHTLGQDADLANADWHRVAINLTASVILISIDNSSCLNCSLTIPISSTPSISELSIGGKTGIDNKGFIGCIRAVELDDITILPTDSSVQLVNVISGCPRVTVCQPSPCVHGQCIDEWDSHKCECTRPWTGPECNTTIVARTFGAKAEDLNKASRRRRRSASPGDASFAKFTTQTTLTSSSEFSFFLKTRESDGLIAFMTSEDVDHVTVVLSSGMVVVQVTIDDNKKKHTINKMINDGQSHLVSISTKATKIDNTTYPGITLSSSITLKSTYLGGLKSWSAVAQDIVIATKGLRGCLQDTRLDNKRFEFSNSSSSQDVFLMVDSGVLGHGCPGEAVCRPQPCANGGECKDIWNDYKCECKPFYGGQNCSLTGCDLAKPCGLAGRCLDVENGHFECVYPATFNASLSQASFSYIPNNNYTLDQQFSFRIKTRQTHAVVFSIGQGLVVRVDNGTLNVSCSVCQGPGSFVSGKVINNGVWHAINFNSSDRVYLTIDTSTETFTGNIATKALTDLLANPVIIGQTTPNALKGCLDNLRVGGALLPFKPYYNASFNVSHVTPLKPQFNATLSGVDNGCRSDDVCGPKPCIRGNCSDIWNAFDCTCPVGFAGPVCNNTANMTCVHQPCINGATCVNNATAHINSNYQVSDYGKDRFVCKCPTGFQGRRCEDVTNECSPSPCVNGGNCTDLHLNFSCSCVRGFAGRRCEVNIDDCVGNNCTNNATCIDGVASYSCNCTQGFNGTYCKQDINECKANVCASAGTNNCTNSYGSYQCHCYTGYYGRNCQYNATQWCAVGKPCINGKCSGNATGFYCACDPGWEGRTCASDIQECLSNPCINNGTCVDSRPGGVFVPGYNCSCTVDWTGKNCENYINPCNATPCANNATCDRISYNEYKCNCTEGYGNMNCTGLTKFCPSNSCENNGICVPLPDDFSCECTSKYKGKTCGELKDKCDSNPCQHGGTCARTSKGYNCSCTKAYNGTNCQTAIDFCKDNKKCQHDSVCVSNTSIANYTCNCTENFHGTLCETEMSVGPPEKRAATDRTDIIIGVAVACILLILLIIIIVCYKKRSGNGTYSPSKQELDGGRVELNSVLKPPNLERLI